MARLDRSNFIRKLFRLVGIWLGLAPLFAQGGDGLSFTVEPDRAVVGQSLRVTLRLPDVEPGWAEGVSLPLPEGVFVTSGPNQRSSSWAEPNGRVQTGTLLTWTVTSRRAGIYSLPRAQFNLAGRRFQTAPAILSFVAPEESSLRFPLELSWQGPEQVFAGQSVFLALQIRNLEFVPEPGLPALNVRPDALVETLSIGGDLKQIQVGPYQLLELSWGRWLITPLRPGNILVPPTVLNVAGIRKTSPELVLPVRPLPVNVGGVGTFTRTARLEEGLEQSDVVVIQILSGIGNFPIVKIPAPVASGYTLLNETEETAFRPTPLGYEGSLVKRFYFRSTDAAVARIVVPAFDYFNPVEQSVRTLPPVELSASGARQVSDRQDRAWEWPPLERLRSWVSLGLLYRPEAYLALVPGLVGFLLLVFRRPGGRRRAVLLTGALFLASLGGTSPDFSGSYERARALYQDGKYSECLEVLDDLVEAHPEQVGFLYPRAALRSRLGRDAEALVDLLRLAHDGVWDADISALADQVQERLGAASNVLTRPLLRPDTVFFLLVLTVNPALVFLGLGLRRGSFWSLSTGASLVVVAVLGLSLFWIGNPSDWEFQGVIGPGAAGLKKIPESGTDTWVPLNRGTVVRILGQANHHYRVTTRDGLEGWVLLEEVFRVSARGR